MIQYPLAEFFPTTSALCPISNAPIKSYCVPGPVRQLVFTLTVAVGTEGVGVKVIVGVNSGVEVDVGSGVSWADGTVPGSSKSAWAVMVNARSGPCWLPTPGRMQAKRVMIKNIGNNKGNFFFDIFHSPFQFDYDTFLLQVKCS